MQIFSFPYHDLSSFPFCPFDGPIFCLFIFFRLVTLFLFNFDGYYWQNILSTKCWTNIYFYFRYRGLVHHHHRILNVFIASVVHNNLYVFVNVNIWSCKQHRRVKNMETYGIKIKMAICWFFHTIDRYIYCVISNDAPCKDGGLWFSALY